MCGIWFYTQLRDQNNKEEIYRASNEIKKRGPDRSIHKHFTYGKFDFYLTFHRLAIMDLSSAGDQPFELSSQTMSCDDISKANNSYQNKSKDFMMVCDEKLIPFVINDTNTGEQIYLMCNGEIYGFENLVKEFSLQNLLKSHSDCEVLIHLYHRFGLKKLYELLTTRMDVSGEFAMIIIHVKDDLCEIHYMRDFCGKRPLYFAEYENIIGYDAFERNFNGLCLTSQLCGLLFPNDIYKKSAQVKASTYGTYVIKKTKDYIETKIEYTENLRDIPITIYDEQEALTKIYDTFMKIVEDQMVSDREVAFMLSGGLDSSLCAGAGAHILKQKGLENKIKTICIGLHGGTDERYAKLVADYIKSEHMHILCTEEEFIDCAENRITHKIESYDITSNRASVPQLLSAEKIKEKTNCKVIIVGDYSDEVCGGYNETKYAPSVEAYKERIYELTEDIIYFDGQRVDRCIGGSGLEARMPFGDHRFIKLILSIDPKLRMPKDSCEKYLLRKAFDGKNIIPDEVLWRPKEAFSDGVSSLKKSWYQIVLEYFDKKYTDEDLEKVKEIFKWNTPYTKESLHYRLKFNEKFSDSQATVVPYFWLPKWGNVKEPSARVLSVYKQ